MFVLMPIVVFLHECGHAAAIILFGGTIAEFHYGLLWGYVRPNGLFTPEQILIIYLAGNVVEVICGVLCLLGAAICNSPPVVACLVYLGIFAIAGTTIFYAIISCLGMYGDWTAIYNTSVTSWLPYIAVCHAFFVITILYAMIGNAPRLWFTCRTRPNWETKWRIMKDAVKKAPSPEKYLDLGWMYYDQGLTNLAKDALKKARSLKANDVNMDYLEGWIKVAERKPDAGKRIFSQITQNQAVTPFMKASSFIAIAEIEEEKVKTMSRGGPVPGKMWASTLEAYTAAELADPTLGDAKYHRARLLNKVGLHTEAKTELLKIEDAKWSDPELAELVQVEYDLASHNQPAEK
jgi:tetratricopeptide (TPR) repeat protein